ncbi:response regulator [Oceanihabitans sediminis]|uniref:Response regulator n=1 Tax=Oceanihabitans sediminis TaxID=1812012 RepID=A0A368P2V7_9FLAO|nr:response regulator [Oceanihabitans sediminis]MDX1277396.1 response regulator [Oceanihabitans sediminis]MDX1774193.1 response regulator [Oceanihabitans sediminis]RCU56766.1 response regulator [Oceanihabitans sediminis]
MNRANLICIIDDDPIFVFAAKKCLKASNLCDKVSVYKNGLEAINNIKLVAESGEVLPDVIFLDINMPIMDGWQFLDEFIKLRISKNITVFIVSSSVDPADIEKSETYSEVQSFLVKPINKVSVLKALREVYEKKV